MRKVVEDRGADHPTFQARVLVAEDAALLRDAFVAQLKAAPGITVVAQHRSGEGIERDVIRLRPDVCLLDVRLPGGDGLSAGRAIKRTAPATKVVLVTGFAFPGLLTQSLRIGLDGVILKSSPYSLPEVVAELMDGRRVIDPDLTIAELAPAQPRSPLTDREKEILTLISRGIDTGEAARELCLSEGTVRNYLTSVVTKLAARTRIDAVRIASSNGWITQDEMHRRG